ncbi:MAG: helix-turn-helix domain-containing protein, partial [Bacteroidetes bacterium]|nr:helix-turn-helix domain-containing protein [Bacteroidota bacterium]
LATEIRNRVQEQFIKDEQKIICATIAFGMGIDKPNVRWVIHNNLPKNIESFYQEIGRAGRDGLPSETVLYFNYGDLRILTDFASQGEMGHIYLEKLSRMHQYAEASVCRRKILMSYFGEVLEENCGNCDICENPKDSFNGLVVAQKAMSAIYRSGEQLGLNLLIDVLRGSNRQEIFEKNLHEIKTYGAGREFSHYEWQGYINQLINLGLIEIAYTDHFNLKITETGKQILFGNSPLQLAKVEKQEFKTKTKKPKQTKTEERNERLLQHLKALRAELAKGENVPAYVIFNDATLNEMASVKPSFAIEFESISGVGEHKLKKYGPVFMKAIRDFIKEADTSHMKGKTYLRTFELYKQGLTVEEMAAERNLAPTTIYSHLAKLIEQGADIAINQFVGVKELERIREAYNRIGQTTEMKPYFEMLEGEIDYGVIRLGLAAILKS